MSKGKKLKSKSRTNLSNGNNKQNINSNISVLDDDSLWHVISFLPVIDRIRIQRVSKRWQRLSKLPWSDVKSLNCNFNLGYRKTMLIKLTTIKNLLEYSGKFLNHLTLPFYHVASTTVLVKLVKKTCPNLRSICFRAVTITRTTARFLIDNFKDFTELNLGGCWPGCEELISKFLSKNTNLRSIQFRCSWRMNGSCMKSLPAESLNEIILDECGHFSLPDVYVAFQNFSNLRLLVIWNSCKLLVYIQLFLSALPNKSSLETLILNSGSNSSRLKDIICMNNIGLFENLRKLTLSGNVILHDQVLITIGAFCKNLVKATLHCSDNVTDRGLQSFMYLPNLEQLAIYSLNNVTEDSFGKNYIPSLKTFRCYDCLKITNGGFEMLLEGCKNLERMDVVGCEIGEDSLISYAEVATAKRDPGIEKVLTLFLLAEDGVEELVKVSSHLHVSRKKEEFYSHE